MKKSILIFLVFLSIIIVTFAVVSGTTSIKSSISTIQGYEILPLVDKSSKINDSAVKLSKLEPDVVIFSARADGGVYGSRTPMITRFRNYNWSINSNMITGIFDCK